MNGQTLFALMSVLSRAVWASEKRTVCNSPLMPELRPPAPSYRIHRQPEVLRGRITMSEDFDQTPTDLLESMNSDL